MYCRCQEYSGCIKVCEGWMGTSYVHNQYFVQCKWSVLTNFFFYDKSKTFAGEAMHERKQGRNTALQVYASKFSIHFTMGDYTLEILYHWTLEILWHKKKAQWRSVLMLGNTLPWQKIHYDKRRCLSMGWDTWDCSRWGRKLLMFSAPLVCQLPGQTHFHHLTDFLGPKCPIRHISSKKDTCVLPDDDSFDWVGGNSRSPHRAPITQTGRQKLWSFGKLPIPF